MKKITIYTNIENVTLINEFIDREEAKAFYLKHRTQIVKTEVTEIPVAVAVMPVKGKPVEAKAAVAEKHMIPDGFKRIAVVSNGTQDPAFADKLTTLIGNRTNIGLTCVKDDNSVIDYAKTNNLPYEEAENKDVFSCLTEILGKADAVVLWKSDSMTDSFIYKWAPSLGLKVIVLNK